MRRILLASALLACASAGHELRLERFRGVYSTHFAGIPDRGEICAVLVNRGTEKLRWARLRLLSYAEPEGQRPWKSDWVFRGAIPPGGLVAVQLLDPPPAAQIELRVAAAGGGRPPERGRTLRAVDDCSERGLIEQLRQANRDRAATGIQIVPQVRRADPEAEEDDDLAVALSR